MCALHTRMKKRVKFIVLALPFRRHLPNKSNLEPILKIAITVK